MNKIIVVFTLVTVAIGFPQRVNSGKYRGMYPYSAIQSREDVSNFIVYSIQDTPPAPLDFINSNEESAEPAPYKPPAPTKAPYSPPVETEAPLKYPVPASYESPAPAPYEEEVIVKGMPYSFSWEVSDKASGNEYGQDEESDGESTNGSYKVLLPDGRTQKVTYKVKPGSGYTADIAYEGEAKFPESSAPYKVSEDEAPYKVPEDEAPYNTPADEAPRNTQNEQAPDKLPEAVEDTKTASTEAPKDALELMYDPDSDAALNRFTFVEQPRSLFK